MVIRGFRKCEISIAIDGSEDNEINIKDLENYKVESDDDDPFATSDDDDSFSDGNSPGSGDEEEHNEEGCDKEDCGMIMMCHLLYHLIQLPMKNGSHHFVAILTTV